MADIFSKAKRSWNMSRIRSENTKPEIVVRSLLHRIGYRFRIYRRDLPGRPDIVLPKYKTVVFVHGCFWHRHKGCKRCTTPKTNKKYWLPKLERNIIKDRQNRKLLKIEGWQTFVIWECEIKKLDRLAKKITKVLQTNLKRDN